MSPVETTEKLFRGRYLIYCSDSVVPTGLGDSRPMQPSSKLLGYFQVSFRDKRYLPRCKLPA